MPMLEINVLLFKKQLHFRMGVLFFWSCLLAFPDTRAGPEGFEYRYLCSKRINLTEVPLSTMEDLTFDSAFSNSLSNYILCS